MLSLLEVFLLGAMSAWILQETHRSPRFASVRSSICCTQRAAAADGFPIVCQIMFLQAQYCSCDIARSDVELSFHDNQVFFDLPDGHSLGLITLQGFTIADGAQAKFNSKKRRYALR